MRPATKPVTDADLDAPDSAVVDGYERVGDVWVDRLVWGRRWRRIGGPTREHGRIVTVVSVSGPPWNIVEYRYTSPLRDGDELGYGHCHGKIVGRTNKTCMSETKFLEAFEPLPGPLARERD